MKKLLSLVAVALLVTSCGSIGSVSTPSTYSDAGKAVSITKKNTNILSLTAMDVQAETEKALKELKSKCPSGVTNITTSTSAKVFPIVSMEKLEISANCK